MFLVSLVASSCGSGLLPGKTGGAFTRESLCWFPGVESQRNPAELVPVGGGRLKRLTAIRGEAAPQADITVVAQKRQLQ